MIFVCSVIAAAVLKITSAIILPFVIAVLLAFVMFPVIKILDKIHCPRILSILIIFAIVIFGIYLFGMVLFSSGKMIVEQYPQYEEKIHLLYLQIANLFDLEYDEALSIWQNLWNQKEIQLIVNDFAIASSKFFFSFISSTIIVVLFIIFILLEAGFFRLKLEVAFGEKMHQIERMGKDIITQVSKYLAAKFIISLANGAIFAVAFFYVGLEFAIVWAIIQFMLNFIPTLGSIVAGAAISLFALIQFWPDPTPFIFVVIVVVATNMILGNILDPKIIGDNVGLSPLMVLISLAIWGYIWGFTGMVLAVPMTVIIKIICENVPVLEPISILIGSKKSVMKKKTDSVKNQTQQ